MGKKIFALLVFVMGVLFSGYAYAGTTSTSTSTTTFSGFDVSIDRVFVNGKVVAASKTNLIDDADVFSVLVDFSAIKPLEKAHIEAILRGRQSSDVVSDSTQTFDLARNTSSSATLTLFLIDSLKREAEFDLTIKIVDARGNSEQKTYGIKTERTRLAGAVDVSIDRVFVNGKVVAASKTNFIDEANEFDVLVEFTALEELEDAHVEATLKDLVSGTVVSDASPNFDLAEDASSSNLLRLELLDNLKDSSSFELTVRIVDAESQSIQKIYGLRMHDNGVAGRDLDISIDSVELENKFLAENENNFVVIGEGKRELDLIVRLTSLENVDSAHIDAVLTFENGNVVSDATTTFDINEDQALFKKLELPLIGRFEQNSFKLKVKVIDAEGHSEEKLYGLRLSEKRFPFVISSISLSPEDGVDAGKSVVVDLTIRNSGLVPLDGIIAKVSIPELGVSASRFIKKLQDKAEMSEEFTLNVPDRVPTGSYTIRSDVVSQFGSEADTREFGIFVVGQEDQTKQIVNDKLIINVPVIKQNLRSDGNEAVYPIILTNQGPDANYYTLLLDGANWADLRLAESNTFVIKPKEIKTINIYASSTSNVAGEHIFVATIKSNDRVLKQIPLKGNVIPVSGNLAAKLKYLLELVLIGLVVVAVVTGFFLGIKKYVQGNGQESTASDEIAEGETYY